MTTEAPETDGAQDVNPSTHEHAKSLAEAQARVMTVVTYLQKKKTEGVSYKFVGEAELIAAARPALLKEGIVVAGVGAQQTYYEVLQSKGGGQMDLLIIAMTYRFTHWPSGQFLDVQSFGQAYMTPGKGAPYAQTIAYKYAIRQFLMLETGTDPDEFDFASKQANAEFLHKAIRFIGQSKSLNHLDTVMNQIRGDADAGWTDHQLDYLHELYAKRRDTLLDAIRSSFHAQAEGMGGCTSALAKRDACRTILDNPTISLKEVLNDPALMQACMDAFGQKGGDN